MKQGIILLIYFWILAGIAQFADISAILGIAILTMPLLVLALVNMDMKK